jgi:uncharacterized membrane protein
VKIIGIKVQDEGNGEFVVEALKSAQQAKKVSLEDIALVMRDEEGKLQIYQTKDVTPKKGAGKGTMIGALVGLAAPPLLGAAAVGAGLGALWGKFRDRGIDDGLMKSVGEMIESGQGVVFALGDDASIDAIADRVRELTDGKMETFTMGTGDEALIREAANDVPEPPAPSVRIPLS